MHITHALSLSHTPMYMWREREKEKERMSDGVRKREGERERRINGRGWICEDVHGYTRVYACMCASCHIFTLKRKINM